MPSLDNNKIINDKNLERASFWAGNGFLAGLAVFFSAFEKMEALGAALPTTLFTYFLGLELVFFTVSALELSRLNYKKFSEDYRKNHFDVPENQDLHKEFHEAVWWARLKVFVGALLLGAVGTVVVVGTFCAYAVGITALLAAAAAVASVAPFIFIGISCLQIVNSSIQLYRHRAAIASWWKSTTWSDLGSNLLHTVTFGSAGEKKSTVFDKDPIKNKEIKQEWNICKAHIRNIILQPLVIAAICLSVITHTYPIMALAATAAFGGAVVYRVGKRLWNNDSDLKSEPGESEVLSQDSDSTFDIGEGDGLLSKAKRDTYQQDLDDETRATVIVNPLKGQATAGLSFSKSSSSDSLAHLVRVNGAFSRTSSRERLDSDANNSNNSFTSLVS